MLFVFLLVPRGNQDPDIWWHLQDVKLQLATHGFLRHDVLSFTAANSRWMNHEWLAEIPYFVGWQAAGLAGLWLVTMLAVGTVLAGAYLLACRRSGSPNAALIAFVPAFLLSSVSFGPRTLLFGWMLLLLELAILYRFQDSKTTVPRSIWLLPLLFAVWVNTHGSWLIGLVLFGVFAAAGLFQFEQGGLYAERWSMKQRATLLKVGIANFAALFCNPYGWRLVVYPLDLAFRQKLNVSNVDEWKSPDFHLFRGKMFLAVLAVLVLFRMLQRTRWSLQDAAFAFLGLYAALTYMRFLFLAAILFTPLLARDLSEWMPHDRAREKRGINLLAFAAIAFVLFTHLPTSKQLNSEPAFPVAATAYLADHPLQGRTFNDCLWGGYLEYHAPQIKPYIDSRMDIFEYNGTLRDYIHIVHLENSLALLDKAQIQNVFVSTQSPLAYFLSHTAGWKTLYKDDMAVVFTRN